MVNRRRLFVELFFLLNFLITPELVCGKTDVWSGIGLAGERVSALALAKPGTVYAGTRSGKLFRIDGSGETWLGQILATESGSITALSVDPNNLEVVFAGTPKGIFKSTDAGIHWFQLSDDVAAYVAITVDPLNSSIVYAAADGQGLFKSVDAGINWTHTLYDPTVRNIVIDPRSPLLVYATTSIGVMVSTDQCTHWVPSRWSEGPARGLAVDPLIPTTLYAGAVTGGLFKSTD